ncbi:MAG TPA: ATP-binding protein [Pirellulales bacterium]|nr:ATP-binding protein [Pirellulales bacterium]
MTTRLTSFFLGVLACVLVGFAVGLYFLADRYLHNQLAERLDSALSTLAAAADVGSDGVEWEPASRSLTLGQDPSPDQVRWSVRDDRGREVDRSKNLSAEEALSLGANSSSLTDHADGRSLDGSPWRVLQKRIAAMGGTSNSSSESGPNTHRALTITVGLSLGPIESTLRTLGLTLSGLSIALWSIAAIAGRWICRQALAPVTRMADAARDMDASDLRDRLPAAETGDELEELARSFNGLLSRLEESFERQRRFTGDASHQLRTPVTAMLGQLDVALLRDRSLAEYRSTLESMRDQAQRLRQIVDSQLFLARADAEALSPALEEIDLARWLREHLERWRDCKRWPDFDRQFSVNHSVFVRAHPELLAQLVDNLLDNAVKYSSAGTPVRIDLVADDANVEFSVASCGRPIATEDLPHVFEPFFRSAEARRLGIAGAGLGLAIAQRIAKSFCGSICVETPQNGGAQFVVRLPRVKTAARNGLGDSANSPSLPSALSKSR